MAKYKNKLQQMLCVAMAVLLFGGCQNQQLDMPQPSDGPEASQNGNSDSDHMQDQALTSLNIAYDSSDTLNPLTFKKEINYYIFTLLFDGLYKTDDTFNPVPNMAQDYAQNGNVYAVTLKEGLSFSDGTAVTAADVAYSAMQMKNAPGVFREKVANIASVTAKTKSVVEFRLNKADRFFLYCLDFPVMKQGTAQNEVPVGSGRFVCQKEDGNIRLIHNERHMACAGGAPETIVLNALPDKDAVMYGVKSAVLDYSFVPASQMSSGSAATGHTSCATNQALFLGVNEDNPFLADAVMRRAISSSLNRPQLVSAGFAGYGISAQFPLNPAYPEFVGSSLNTMGQETSFGTDVQGAEQMLEQAGYGYPDTVKAQETSKFRQKDGKTVSFRLLVSTENTYKVLTAKQIKKQLEQNGIGVELQQVSFSDYTAGISAGTYDLYLGETNLPMNLDLDCFFGGTTLVRQSGRYAELKNSYESYHAGDSDVDPFLTAFSQQMPFIPLMFTKGTVVYSKRLQFQARPSCTDIFYNLCNWPQEGSGQ